MDIKKNNFHSVSSNITTTSKTSHNSEPAKYFHESHNLIDDPDVTILQTNIKTAAAQGIMWTNGFVNQKL